MANVSSARPSLSKSEISTRLGEDTSRSTTDIEKAAHLYRQLRRMTPATRQDLKNYLKVFLGIDIPDKNICPQHNSPMDYLWHCFSADLPASLPCHADSERSEEEASGYRIELNLQKPDSSAAPQNDKTRFDGRATKNADCVVWANRTGGKTELAAVATLLDCIFKPNCQVRILGGSGEQSARMYEYLTSFINRGFDEFLARPALKTKCCFSNGSSVEVLTQSATSVRGQHIQKLRCDEVELFDEDVFAAAKFTTQSTEDIVAAMEMISTMHRPYGLMQKIVSDAQKFNTPIFKWCIWEVIEKCTPDSSGGRNCSQCPLWCDCRGKAKNANGYLKIDDCITAMHRSSRAGWEAEMLCKKPSLENVVFDEFDTDTHVKPVDYDPNLPLYRSLDFGFVNPFVCLWIQVDQKGNVRVIDEYIRSRATIDVHAKEVKSRTPVGEEKVAATFCDPAGAGTSDITGTSVVRELRTLAIQVRFRRSSIQEGIELIRRAIRDGSGKSSLVISPRCARLIEALQCYHYPDFGSSSASELPLKDGLYDHPIDALRYFFVNHTHHPKTTSRRY